VRGTAAASRIGGRARAGAVRRAQVHSRLHARRAGFNFEDAWLLAAGTVLSHRDGRDARELWDVLDATRDGWHDAYTGRRSRLIELRRQ